MNHEFLVKARARDFARHARATGYNVTVVTKKQNQDGRKKVYCVYVYR